MKAVDPRLEEKRDYGVVTGEGPTEKVEGSRLSHAAAMSIAENLRRGGKVARVMHVVGDKSYEVDRYPVR